MLLFVYQFIYSTKSTENFKYPFELYLAISIGRINFMRAFSLGSFLCNAYSSNPIGTLARGSNHQKYKRWIVSASLVFCFCLCALLDQDLVKIKSIWLKTKKKTKIRKKNYTRKFKFYVPYFYALKWKKKSE